MGRRKGSKNKSTIAKENSRKTHTNYESKNISSVVTCFIGVFLGVIVFMTTDGKLSLILSNILGGLFGNIKFVIPIVISIIGIYGMMNGKEVLKPKLVQSVILIMILSGVLSWMNYSFDTNLDFSHNVSLLYENGINLKDGGLIGGLITMPFYEMFGKIPTLIILIALLSIMFVLTTGIMPNVILEGIRTFFGNIFGLINNNEIKREVPHREHNVRKENMRQNNESIEEQKREKRKNTFISSQLTFDFLDNKDEEKKVNTINKVNEEINKEVNNNITQQVNNISKTVEDKVGDLNEIFKTKTKEQIQEEKEELNRKEELKISHNEIERHDEEYVFPSIDLLNMGMNNNSQNATEEMKKTAEKLQSTLDSFGVDAKVVDVARGPSVTRYEIQPNAGVKVSKIVNLADDIALNLAASNIRIEAPIPGKAAVGIEVPNKATDMVTLRELIETDKFRDAKSKLSYALGKDIAGDIEISDIAKMPHMLISGATGSGKSVCINTIITSILYKAKPNEVKLLMIDPKVVELGIYNGIPHLLIPVVTDPKKAAGALNWAVQEMVMRYNLFAQRGVKDIKGYNEALKRENEEGTLPQIVIIIDELADLMMVAANEVEDAICRLAQMARAAGMYLVIATQRPSVDVITGIIKANIPSRIAFAVSSQIDSRTILDTTGAEKLLGKGDMLYYPTGKSKPVRLQGAFVSEKEIESIVEFIKSNSTAVYDDTIIDKIEKADQKAPDPEEASDADQLLPQAIDLVVEMGQASASMIQRKFKVGYARAGRIIDQMEARGIISGYDGSKPRQVLISRQELQEIKMGSNNTNNVEEQVDNTVVNETVTINNNDETKIDELKIEENVEQEEKKNNVFSFHLNKIANNEDTEDEDDINVYAVDGDYE
ncbi:MAG: DNA translocase FtsK [Clostridiales bacterium]|nr:DNA translocase FtsK [Clostridiales bacterium]